MHWSFNHTGFVFLLGNICNTQPRHFQLCLVLLPLSQSFKVSQTEESSSRVFLEHASTPEHKHGLLDFPGLCHKFSKTPTDNTFPVFPFWVSWLVYLPQLLKDVPLKKRAPQWHPAHRLPPREGFPKFSHPGTQRPVPLWSRGAQLTLKLASDLGITHMILVCRHTKCKSNRAWRLPPRFQRKGWKARWYKAESDSLQVVPEWEVHEAVRVKSKL
jgi:hypothetical protein